MLIKILGFCAAALTTIAFLPQAIKTWKTKSTSDISFWMFLLLFTGIVLWFFYGLLSNDLPIMIANGVTMLFAGSILYYLIFPEREVKISHVAIWVNDLEKQKDFYCFYFNGKAGKKYYNPSKNFSSYFISLGTGARIELMHNPQQPLSLSNNHIALAVGSKKNVDELTHALIEKGVQLVSGPRITGDGYYESVFHDPEGNIIEITV